MVLIDDFLFNADGFACADVSGFAEAVETLQFCYCSAVACCDSTESFALANLVSRSVTASRRFTVLRSVVSALVVAVLIERISIGVSSLVFEVENSFRVDSYTHETGLEVKVRTGAVAGVAAEGDWLTGFYALVGLN